VFKPVTNCLLYSYLSYSIIYLWCPKTSCQLLEVLNCMLRKIIMLLVVIKTAESFLLIKKRSGKKKLVISKVCQFVLISRKSVRNTYEVYQEMAPRYVRKSTSSHREIRRTVTQEITPAQTPVVCMRQICRTCLTSKYPSFVRIGRRG
jgi:hypothetical protein